MPNYDVSVRQDWFLPLVGGAEFNRIKLPKPIIFTSRPYPAEAEDATTADFRMRDSFDVNYLDTSTASLPVVYDVTLRTTFQAYALWPVETITSSVVSITGATLATQFKEYKLWPFEPISPTTVQLSSITLKQVLISYTRWPTENIQATITTLTGATLT